MASDRPSKPDVVTYGDHEMITPDTRKLRKTAAAGAARRGRPGRPRRRGAGGDLRRLLAMDARRMRAARRRPPQGQGTAACRRQTRQELFLAAHDVKGDSGTLGYPEVGAAADSLCRLLEHTPDLTKIPLAIVDQHVDAVRAIVREHERPDIAAIAAALTGKLRAVTDEFLVKENRAPSGRAQDDPEPALAPGESF